jgi:hypothetical protein
MKLWFTRPECDEIYMGGLRSVDLWLSKPVFDQRATTLDFELIDPLSGGVVAEIYHEVGWSSHSGCVRAKEFLAQDKAVTQKVWDKIYESILPIDCPVPEIKIMGLNEFNYLLDYGSELQCRTHWKRFLLELDLRTDSVKLIEPDVLWNDSLPKGKRPITSDTALTSLFYDGNLNRPFLSRVAIPYEETRKNIVPF